MAEIGGDEEGPFGGLVLLGFALFAGGLLAIKTRFFVPWWVLVLVGVGLAFLSIVTTLLNPAVRSLFRLAAAVVWGAAIATILWAF